VGPQTFHEIRYFDLDARLVFPDTSTLNFQFISAGSGDNLIMRALFHSTVNANGEVTSFLDITGFECYG
jgi:hypothetical protein